MKESTEGESSDKIETGIISSEGDTTGEESVSRENQSARTDADVKVEITTDESSSKERPFTDTEKTAELVVPGASEVAGSEKLEPSQPATHEEKEAGVKIVVQQVNPYMLHGIMMMNQ